MFSSLFDYLKNYETKISESEVPELQFLSVDLYKSDTFNVNSVVKIISTKLKDTNYLINQLKLTVAHLKNEIVEQINSNFQNYIVLISKLQAIDFLIENIQKPLDDIKNKIMSEINFASNYENELGQILIQIKENEIQVKNIKQSMKFYKCYDKSKEIIRNLEIKYLSNNLFRNIIINYPDENIVDKNNYDILRKYLVDVFRFLTTAKSFYDVSEKLSSTSYAEEYLSLVNEIRQEEIKFMINVEDLLRVLLTEFFNDNCDDESFNKLLIKNLFALIFKLYYIIPKNELILFNKILENNLQSEIEKIFENTNQNLSSKFEEVSLLYDQKYKIFQDILDAHTNSDLNENKSQFFLHCFISEVINRLYSDKFIFNCVDSLIFRENYNSFLNYIGKFVNLKNFDKFNQADMQQFQKIKNFSQSFSFFTYFQFIQNDFLKILLEDFGKLDSNPNKNIENDNNVSLEILEKMIIKQKNFLFNFTKVIENIFQDKKLFMKNLTNFLYFTGQSLKYLIKKQKDLYSDNNIKYFLNLSQTEENFSLADSKNTNLRKAIVEYSNMLHYMLSFFFNSHKENSKCLNELIKIVDREIFMLENSEQYNKLLSKLAEFIQSNKAFVEENINLQEEAFLKYIIDNNEIKFEIKLKLN